MTLPTLADVASAVAPFPCGNWPQQCHAASLHLVRSGLLAPFGEPGRNYRVVRGTCAGVGSQHSWVVIGDPIGVQPAIIIDTTLWSYEKTPPVAEVTNYTRGYKRHRPAGVAVRAGRRVDIFDVGQPEAGDGEPIELDVEGFAARCFLEMLGPLDVAGWSRLFNKLPMTGWPSKPITTAAAQHPKIAARIPIDIRGIYTDLNPEELYW